MKGTKEIKYIVEVPKYKIEQIFKILEIPLGTSEIILSSSDNPISKATISLAHTGINLTLIYTLQEKI